MANIHDFINTHLQDAAVFPLGLTTKFPAAVAKGWNNAPGEDPYYDCFQPLPKTLTSKSGKDLPLTGYGVNLRQSRLVVVDIDVNHTRPDGTSADGIASWEQLTMDLGVELPPTLTTKTMSGGKHIWFRAPEDTELPELIGKLGDGIDFKASGMAVGPLTSAKKWNDEGKVVAEGRYEVVSDHPIAPVPEWLATLVQETYAATRRSSDDSVVLLPDLGEFPDHYARKALESAFYVVANAPRGERSDTVNREAYGAAKAGAPISKVVEDLSRAAMTYGDWPENDLRHTILRSANEGARAYVPRPQQHTHTHGGSSSGGGGTAVMTKPAAPKFVRRTAEELTQEASKAQALTADLRSKLADGLRRVEMATTKSRSNIAHTQAKALGKAGIDSAVVLEELLTAFDTDSQDTMESALREAHAEGFEVYKASRLLALEEEDRKAESKARQQVASENKLAWSAYYMPALLGDRFLEAVKRRLIYVRERKVWFIYKAKTGEWEQRDTPNSLVKRFLRKEYDDASASDSTDRKAFAEVCLSARILADVAKLIQDEVEISASELDSRPDLFVAANCVIDLRTGESLPFDASYLLTEKSPTTYRETPTELGERVWRKYLGAVPEDAHDWLQIVLGQAMTGHRPSDASAYFFFADGENGKSFFMDAINRTLGDYSGMVPSDVLLSTAASKDFKMMIFKGLRLGIAEELPSEKYLDVHAVKQLAGTPTLVGCFKGKDYENFTNQTSLFINTNELPNVKETDRGTWRRLKVIPFPYTFKKTEADLTDPNDRLYDAELIEHQHNPEVSEACLAWMVEGARRWYEMGSKEPAGLPKSVQNAVDSWRYRGDRILHFADPILVPDQDSFVLAEDLRDCFKTWMADNGYSRMGSDNLYASMERHPAFFKKFGITKQRMRPKGKRQSEFFDLEACEKAHRRCRLGDNESFDKHIKTCSAYSPRVAGPTPVAFWGVRFRTEADNEEARTEALTPPPFVEPDCSFFDDDYQDLDDDDDDFEF